MLPHSFRTLALSTLLSNLLGGSAAFAGYGPEQDVFVTVWQTKTVTTCPYSILAASVPCSSYQSSSLQPYSTSSSITSSILLSSSSSSNVIGSGTVGTTSSSSSTTMTSSSSLTSRTSSSTSNIIGPGTIGTSTSTSSTSTRTSISSTSSTTSSSVMTTSTSSSSSSSSSSTTTTTSTTTSPVSSPTDVTYSGGFYNVAGLGIFTNMRHFVFNSTTLPTGLHASDYPINDTANGLPYNHMFDPSNVYTDGTFVNLRVRADPNPQPGSTVSCAEIVTDETNIMYASVRTKAIFSTVPGTCHGNFFYRNDNEECDIEYLTDPNSQSNPGSGQPIPLWLTNQALSSMGQPTQSTSPGPQDVTVVHEYRIDWVKGYTAFYLDGQLMKKYTSNVPNKSGSWIWNNWSNGDPGWSVGPPTQDNIFRIQEIYMYFNTASN